MTGPMCPECGTEGIADVWWEDEDGVEVDVPTGDDPSEHITLTKNVARECPNCGHYWEYTVQ